VCDLPLLLQLRARACLQLPHRLPGLLVPQSLQLPVPPPLRVLPPLWRPRGRLRSGMLRWSLRSLVPPLQKQAAPLQERPAQGPLLARGLAAA